MSKAVWEQQCEKWHAKAADWQGRWLIIDVELELELQRIALLISWIFANMAKGYARRFKLLDRLKRLYDAQCRTHKMAIDTAIELEWICLDCWNLTYYVDSDETVPCSCTPKETT